MFDDLTPKNPNEPTLTPTPSGAGNGPVLKGPEDIFAATEAQGNIQKEKPAIFQPKQLENIGNQENFSLPNEFASQGGSNNTKKIYFALLGAFVIILFFFGLWYGYNTLLPKLEEKSAEPDQPNVQVQESSQESAPTDQSAPQNTQEPAASIPVQPSAAVDPSPSSPSDPAATPASNVDSDSDGLTDEEEKTLGTNSNEADTDRDGLYDREEVRVYHTNPLQSDTDQDSFADGVEVKNGFNPAGTGKLFEIKE